MAGRASDRRGGDSSSTVHESIEFKAPSNGADDMDADGDADPEMDADADADGDVEMEDAGFRSVSATAAGGDDDASKQAQAAAARAKRELLHLIETTAHYLSAYEEDGVEVCSGFQRIPNKRLIPDYFDVIKEPTAFSTIRGRIQKRTYTQFSQFVRDAALICHNAQVYNRPSAPIFQDAVKLREALRQKLQQLVKEGSITAKDAEIPYLGEIPDFSPSPPPAEGEVEEEEEEDDDEDDEEDGDSDEIDIDEETGHRRRRAARTGGSAGPAGKRAKQNSGAMASNMLTANEARLNAVLEGLRGLEDEDGEPLLDPFEELPDREELPDYYEEIRNPIAVDIIQKRSRCKMYATIDAAMADLDIMFNNARIYNQDGSPIYVASIKLQNLARKLVAQQRAKPDDSFRDEHGRLALPNVQHLGQLWRAGDWVLLRNANDPNKPIIGQIFRMWVDLATGVPWVNACWYYRPEQTVHRYDRHFLQNEVIKTEQYRDHPFMEVLDRTFVMFAPQYVRGQPRGYPPNKTLYVCAYRYSEDKFQFTKVVKWDPLMPEEVRGLEILMDVFPTPRTMTKYASPIKHLLHDDARETDALPKPAWGNRNAPPIVGAVHRRPRLPNESPPPETSHPAPQPATTDIQFDPSRRGPMPGTPQGYMQPGAVPMPGQIPGQIPGQMPLPGVVAQHPGQPYAQQQFMPRPRGPGVPPNVPSPHMGPQHGVVPTHSPSPVPIPPHMMQHQQFNVPQGQRQPTPGQQPHMMVPPPGPHQHQMPHQLHHNSHLPPQAQHHPGMPGYSPSPQMHQQQHFMPPTATPTPPPQSRAPMASVTPAGRQTPIAPPQPPHYPHQQGQQIVPPPVPVGYAPPRATSEAYVLPESVESTIPEELRKHYHRDAQGRVLFFTAPSVPHGSETPAGKEEEASVRLAAEYSGLGHSAHYLNGLEQFREERRLKRKARDEAAAADEASATKARAAKAEADVQQLYASAGEALGGFVEWMNTGTRLMYAEGEEESEKDSQKKGKQATGQLVAGQS